ncbi:hypothetical protein [Vibrio vulnificus]|uniref:hypothetical protein n=1 Tax=Vibrio vulnificus TaxID=672 RepID=UPI00307E4BD9
MTIKETQLAEIVVEPKTLSPVAQVTDATQQEEDCQPKILAILDKIESNTSALLRRAPLAGDSTVVQSFTHQNNTDSVSKRHQSNTQQVFNASSEAAQRPVSRQAEKAPESGRPHQALPVMHKATERDSQAWSVQAIDKQAERVHEQNNTYTAITTPVHKKETKPHHAKPSTSPATESRLASTQKQREIHRYELQTPTESVVSTANQYQGNAPDDKGSVTASQQAQEEQKEKREQSGLLATVGNVLKKAVEEREELEAGDTATDAAGSAMGGSLWEAAKEVKEATDDIKNSSLGQKVLEKVTGKKADSSEADDKERNDASSKAAASKETSHSPVRDDKGRFIKRAEAQALSYPAPSLEVERKSDTHKTLNEYQYNTKSKDKSRQGEDHKQSESDRQSREVSTHDQTSVTSANVVREREQTRSNEAIADRLDEQYDLSQDQHKELIKTIDKKEFGGEGGGSLMDSVSELSDMFGGGDGKEKGGGKRRRDRGRKGRLGSLIDRFKGSKGAAGNASALKGAPTTRLGRVAQGVKNATGTLANSSVGKVAGGALKTVGSVASRAAAPVAALATGYFKYNEVKDREDLTGSQKAVQVGATTAGSLGGASAGAAMGAAMGSVVPVVGTLIGGLLGAAVGGWLGSKGGDIVGEAISNRMKGTDGKTRAEREAETLQSTIQSSETVTTNGDKSDLPAKSAESAQVTSISHQESSEQGAGSTHVMQASEMAIMPEQLKVPLPEVSPSKSAMNQSTNKETHTEKTETVAKIDEKKLGKAIVDAMSKSQQQSGVSASASGHRYAATQSKSVPVTTPIKTEFEDKVLVLMAHDRI